MKKNYQIELDRIISDIEKREDIPSLLLHSCCGPCSSYVLEYLSKYFSITVFYYNPNIYPSDEYWYRVDEQQKIIDLIDSKNKIRMITGEYETEKFYKIAQGLEDLPEGGERCHKCYEMRLREAAIIAKNEGYDYFTTTLSISPHKNSQVLNAIGEKIGEEFGIKHLPSDFKKNNGYKRSVEITRNAGLYRQDYCGCIFSKKEAEQRELRKNKRILRENMKEISSALDVNYLQESEKIIIEKLINSEEYKNSKNIFSYVGEYPEINTRAFIQRALEDGKNISVPYCVDEEIMIPYEIGNLGELVKGRFGLMEPDIRSSRQISIDEIDLIIVPCCTADKNGNRLGFGRGYYDRFLEKSESKTVLLIREKQMSDIVPTDENDIRIEKVITEKN